MGVKNYWFGQVLNCPRTPSLHIYQIINTQKQNSRAVAILQFNMNTVKTQISLHTNADAGCSVSFVSQALCKLLLDYAHATFLKSFETKWTHTLLLRNSGEELLRLRCGLVCFWCALIGLNMVWCIGEDDCPPYYILVYLTLPFPSIGWFGVFQRTPQPPPRPPPPPTRPTTYKVKVKNLFSINPRQRIMTEENMTNTNIDLSLQILEI